MFISNNFYEVLNPVFYTGKLFGLAPFNLNRKYYRKSYVNIVYSTAVAVFIYILSAIVLLNQPPLKASAISTVTEIIDSYINQFGMCFIIIFHCINSNKIVKSLQDIHQFDETFYRNFHIDLKNEYIKTQIYIMIMLFVTLIYLGVCVVFTLKAIIRTLSIKHLGEIILYTGPNVISTLAEFQFCVIVLCLKRRFGWLNKIILGINKIAKTQNALTFSIFTTMTGSAAPIITDGLIQDKMLIIFESIRKRHHTLCTIVKNINASFSVQILFIILQNFLTIMLALFYVGKYIILNESFSIKYILYAVNQFMLSLVQLVIMVFTCSSTVSESQNTGLLIYNTMSKHYVCKGELYLETSYFSLQLFHQSIEFTACGTFAINENLLLSIAAAISTYLVIVAQFELGEFFHHS